MENDLIFFLLPWMEGFPGGRRRCLGDMGSISGQENPLEGMAAHSRILAGGSHRQRSLVAFSAQRAMQHLDAQEMFSLKKKNLK